jgi:Omp85 superfamily domain
MTRLLARHAMAAMACAVVPLMSAAAQQPAAPRDTVLNPRLLPAEVEREVTDAFNSANTVKATGAYEVESGRVVPGDVAVLNGPLTIAGRVNGRVIAINSDVILRPGARVEGQILVVGGNIDGKDDAFIGGDVRTYRQRLTYRREGDRLIASGSSEEDARWWKRRQKWRSHSYSDLRLVSAKTYNRVEGLPIFLGPSFGHRSGDTRLEVNALGIFRTGENLEWNSETIGHSLKVELSAGRGTGLAIGGRLFDVVDPAEEWQLRDVEVGLASFFLHRDYRDYYNRHGGSGYVRLSVVRGVDLTASLSDERWAQRKTLDPFTLFRNGQDWRPNPDMDEGRFHIANGTLHIDTRSDEDDPRSGWNIVADYEHGTGQTTLFGATSPGVRDPDVDNVTTYGRGFLDLRRYNRVSPEGQLNLRVVAGGWLNGDELPLQRRFSLGGPGALDGYPFRRTGSGDDVRQCSTGGEIPLGVPAQCERMLLFQAEYRGDVWMSLFGDWDWDDSWRGGGWHHRAQWVVFADAGRGWLVGDRVGELQYPKDRLPSLSTFKTDIGLGFDAGMIGFYIAKSISDSKEPPNFFVRVGRRF